MRRGFHRDRQGRITLRLESVEVVILTDLVQQILALVEPGEVADADPLAAMVGIDDSAIESDDPAVQRLFPNAYPDDDAASSDFRRFTERSLREGKVARAQMVLEGLEQLAAHDGRSEVEVDEARAWLGVLNDLRLVLAARLGVDDDEGQWRAAVSGDDEAEQGAMLYDWLTWLQDGLVDALTG